MVVISSREFREKQAEYMDLADSGEQIIIQRGKNKAYSITPVLQNDLYFSPQLIEKIRKALNQAEEGNVTRVNGKPALKQFLDTLEFTEQAIDDLRLLKRSEPSAYKKAQKLLLELMEHPRTGTTRNEKIQFGWPIFQKNQP